MDEQQQQQEPRKDTSTHGTVTPTETTAATSSASMSTMTPTKTSSESSLSLAAAVGVNSGDGKSEKTHPGAVSPVVDQALLPATPAAEASAETGGAAAQQVATSAFALPKEATQYSPLLVGKYYIQDKRAVWTGRWGMTEAAFEGNGLTSMFEMKSQEDVYIATCAGSRADAVHPAFADGSLARSMTVGNVPASEICPAYFGYESNASVRSAMPFQSKYSGFFQIQAAKGKSQTVAEKDVEIRFVHDPSLPSHFLVSGSGENRFGLFSLHGSLNKVTSELRVYKVYKPREKEKRSLPRRSRTVKAAPLASTVKLQIKEAPVAAVAAPAFPGVATLPITVPMSSARPVSIAAPQHVATPVDLNTSLLTSRGRSERKRVAPAHLREENMIEFDHVSHSVKKCHGILKGLMANPKSSPFLAPVDPVALGIPDYFQVIKEPMDLGTIRQNLEGGYYANSEVFADHVRLVFRNAMLYNAAHSQVHIFAVKLLEDFEKRMASLNMKSASSASASLKDRQSFDKHKMMKSSKKEKKHETGHSSKKLKGGKGAKGNTKRMVSESDQGLIMSLKEDLERLKATLEQLQPGALKIATPKPSRPAAKPFKMEDLTEEELNEPMSQMDKARLGADIRSLPQDKINRVLQIIAEAVPVAKLANEHGEVEIDINAFDTRCLRMLEGYVRENGIGRKRKRPASSSAAKKGKTSPPVNRLKSAKVAALNIRNRQEELKSQLAAIDSEDASGGGKDARSDVVMTDVDGGGDGEDLEKKAESSSDSSSSSSESSDSESDSDSDSESDDEAPIQRSPSLVAGPALSQIPDSGTSRTDASAKKIRDEVASAEPLVVENRGAWSLLAQKESSNGKSPVRPEESQTSSLWLSARSMEQQKQQKLQLKEKARSEELEAQRRREAEQREREKEREREELARRKQEQEAQARRAREEREREAERARVVAQRAAEREKLSREPDDTEQHEHTLTEDLESFSSSSFL